MRLEKYALTSNATKTQFEFISKGPKGSILKCVIFSKMKIKGYKNLYNLEFGDKRDNSDEIDDLVISDNQDRDIVLVTVANAILNFFEKHPKSQVFFQGSTPSRTRLYQIAISKYFDELSLIFNIQGFFKNSFVPFGKNTNYAGFLIHYKKIEL